MKILFPILISAKELNMEGIFEVIWYELFISIFYIIGVFKPLANILATPHIKAKPIMWSLFFMRFIVIAIFILLGFPKIIIVDILLLFILPFFVLIFGFIFRKIKRYNVTHNKMEKQLNMFCKKCGNKLDSTEINCPVCGTKSHLVK